MESIVKALLDSDQNVTVKKAFIDRIVRLSNTSHNNDQVIKILQTCISEIVVCSDQTSLQMYQQVFEAWSRNNQFTFETILNDQIISDLLTHTNDDSARALWILEKSFQLLENSSSIVKLCSSVQKYSITFIDASLDWKSLGILCKLMLDYPLCVPSGENLARFCVCIIQCVASYQIPLDFSDRQKFFNHLNQHIAGLLRQICYKSTTCILTIILQAVFDKCSKRPTNAPTCKALAAIMQHVPEEEIRQSVKAMLDNNLVSDIEIQNAVFCTIDWLHWPNADGIDKCTVIFLKALISASKFTVFAAITSETIKKLMIFLRHKSFQTATLRVLECYLLSYQPTPDLFYEVLPDLNQIAEQCKAGKYEPQFSSDISTLLHSLVQSYPQDSFNSSSVSKLLANLPEASQTDIDKTLNNSVVKQDSMTSSTCLIRKRSVTGKCGLQNLGNTCYMNAILQAMYMCDSFRQDILKYKSTSKQNLLKELQEVFAFLSTSLRSSYSPESFLEAARPPWFIAGEQQDCSEFLHHMLMQLHEQHCAQKMPTTDSSMNEMEKAQDKQTVKVCRTHMTQCENATIVQENFGGLMNTIYKCETCNHESVCSEMFTSVSLAFPGCAKAKAKDETAETLTLETLLEHYLKPERLEGDNRYFCNKCNSLQTAERCLKILEAPQHLFITLMRFAYDASTQRKTKIFNEVMYPKCLNIPVHNTDTGTVTNQMFCLQSVVVHSGYTERGHYYCYSRHSLQASNVNAMDSKSDVSDANVVDQKGDDIDYLQDKWYLFNDENVSYTQFSQINKVSSSFGKRDTAYVLIYRRVSPGADERDSVNMDTTVMPNDVDLPLCTSVMEVVYNDNSKYLQEQECAKKLSNAKSSKANKPQSNNKDHDTDPGPPPGSCGGGLNITGPRFVC